ncbi:MAG: hypothetical protein OCC49_14520 [Fibrobacterales bacterium]
MSIKIFITSLMIVIGVYGTGSAQNFLKDNTFSHTYHVVEEEVGCTDCHTEINAAGSIGAIQSVKASVCTDCHEDDITEEQILEVTFDDKSFQLFKKRLPGELFFSHESHIKRDTSSSENKKCSSCHGDITPKGETPTALPTMASCVTCHTEQQASITCATCHPTAVRPVSQKTAPTTFLPSSHKSGVWLSGDFHGRDAQFKKQDCSMCHKDESTCTDCHLGLNGKKVHGLNYEYTHGMDVKFKRKNCSTCHVPVEQFCGDCHFSK